MKFYIIFNGKKIISNGVINLGQEMNFNKKFNVVYYEDEIEYKDTLNKNNKETDVNNINININDDNFLEN